MICWKIRIFAYWTTPVSCGSFLLVTLWFAEKFVSLLIEQHHPLAPALQPRRCDLLKNSYLCLLNNTAESYTAANSKLWFAEKFVSLLIEQHLHNIEAKRIHVVICWKIRIFAYWTTPAEQQTGNWHVLWFAEKFVSLLIEQHLHTQAIELGLSCDLLKNSYLCLLNNTTDHYQHH